MSTDFTSLKIVNVVLTARLQLNNNDVCVDFDMNKIAETIADDASVEYYPKKFAALKLCRPSPFAKALFFRSGKIVCVGNRSEAGGHEAIEWFCRRIAATAANCEYQINDVTVQNIVATTMLKNRNMRFKLDRAARIFPKHTQYEPELFPGCAFRFGESWKQVVNVFTSGKLVMTGVKNSAELIILGRMFFSLLAPKMPELILSVEIFS